MKTFNRSLIDFVNEKEAFHTLLLIFILLLMVSESSLCLSTRFLVSFFALLGLMCAPLKKNTLIWSVISMALGHDLFTHSRFVAANHCYLAFYTSLCVLFEGFFRQGNDDQLFLKLRWLFIVFMGFATLQKVLSVNFLSGDFMAMVLMTNPHFDTFLSGLYDFSFADLARWNADLEIAGVHPRDITIKFKSYPQLFPLATGMAWGAIFIEFFLVLLAFMGKRRDNILAAAILFFVVATSLIRVEYAFLSLVSLYGFAFARRRLIKLPLLSVFLFFSIMSVLDGTMIFHTSV